MTQDEPCDVPVSDWAVLDSLAHAVIVSDPSGRILRWNAGATELFGWEQAEVLGRSVFEVLVPLSEQGAGERVMERVRVGEAWQGDFTVLRRDGDMVRISIANSPVRDETGRVVAVVGLSQDVGERRLLEQQALDLAEHLRLALEAGGLGTWRWDQATGVTTWDARTEALFGFAPGAFDGTFDTWMALVHPDDRDDVLGALDRAVAERSSYTVDHRVVWPDGSIHWIHGAGAVTVGSDGEVTGAIGCSLDVTERMVADQERRRLTAEALALAEREREHRERLEVLGRINDVLATARTLPDLMTAVANTVVPRLADWCSLYVLPTADAIVPVVEVAHGDPDMVRYARDLQARFPYNASAPTGVPAIIRDGHTEFYPDLDERLLEDLGITGEARDIVDRLALRSAIAVPLVKRGRVVGAMSFLMTSSRRRYTADDLALAQAAAARVASSIENLRLSTQHREIASTLQASLLPATLPAIPGVSVAVRYWAAGDGVDVGGDFYDVFALDDDHWAVVMGDVCGTGPSAAAITGLARHTLAAGAWLGLDPEGVLRHLNGTLRRRRTDTFLTVAYGQLEPEPEGFCLRLAVGGHPLPVLVRAGGGVESAGAPGTLLGVVDTLKVAPTEHHLASGDTLVLYTDGVTDVPPPHALTAEDFRPMVRRAATGEDDVEVIAERIRDELATVLPVERRSDDIALLVLRVG